MKFFWSAKAREGPAKAVDLVGLCEPSQSVTYGFRICRVAPEDIARNTPLMETEASRQRQTYHTADGGVIKNKGENIVTMYSER